MTVQLVVKVPEELRQKVRAVAALRGETVSDVVRAALAEYIDEALADAEDIRATDEIIARIKAGQPTYSHEEVWAELEALEEEGALPD